MKLCAYSDSEMEDAQSELKRLNSNLKELDDFDDFGDEMEFDEKEEAIIKEGVDAMTKEMLERLDKIEKTW